MIYTYKTKGTCSLEISFELEEGVVKNVQFSNGCSGNLQGISALVEGMPIDDIIKKISGIKCGMKPTSCPDQLANALRTVKSSR